MNFHKVPSRGEILLPQIGQGLQAVATAHTKCRESNPSHQHKYNQNHQDQSQPAAGEVAPASAMVPGGQCTQQKQNQNDEHNDAKHFNSPGKYGRPNLALVTTCISPAEGSAEIQTAWAGSFSTRSTISAAPGRINMKSVHSSKVSRGFAEGTVQVFPSALSAVFRIVPGIGARFADFRKFDTYGIPLGL